MSTAAPAVRRTQVRARGTVQGVGFRPYVHRLAGELGLGGYVLNDTDGVLIEVEGPPPGVAAFLDRLRAEAPPLAVVEELVCAERPPTGARAFVIRPSPAGGVPDAPVTPDSATCADCLRELFDRGDRRFRYPFINCTNCGPRFTIIRGVPYDRLLTTMAGFVMCERCRTEYEDPGDRRFHAQPNACPVCGPSLALLQAGLGASGSGAAAGALAGAGPWGDAALAAAVAGLAAGAIVAVKGIGGYHLACRADDEAAVARLRARKHREDRPFAIMAPDLVAASALVVLGDAARALLTGPQRPIVLAPRRPGGAVAPSLAPGAPELGVMLPYSPLHHLLLADLGLPLVMTSGNVSDEPIAFRDDDAAGRLAMIADLILVHDRPIHTRTDDSVIRVTPRPGPEPARGVMIRRSRGYVPDALRLPGDGTPRPLLACGAEQKNTFCLARGRRAWVGPHIGDLANYETLRSFTDGIAHFATLFAVTPEIIVHDLHPEYLSTKYALDHADAELIGVQHHHAHFAACLAEHGAADGDRPTLGVIYDGTGYGLDGTVWGGELLLGGIAESERVGALAAVALPGGERAIRQPWRMACAWLAAADGAEATPELPRTLAGRVDARAWAAIARLAATGVASPPTSSMGRLFDAVAALAGIRTAVTYEGQAAIELEAACDAPTSGSGARDAYPVALADRDGLLELDPREAIRAVAGDAAAGRPAGLIARRFHAGIAAATVAAVTRLAAQHDVDTVVLSGGVFQNRILLEAVAGGLTGAGLRVLVPRRLPVNDGGISYGQAAVAAARLARAEARMITPEDS